MKLIKLTAVSAAVLASTAALAAEPVVVVDNNDAVVYEAEPVVYQAEPVAYQAAQPAYQYDNDAGMVRNTTGAVVGGTKTFFGTVFNPAAISAEIGTLGYGANIGWALNDKTELQAGWAGGDVSDIKDNFDVNDIEYDIKDADFSNPYLGVQIRPAANWFTMAGGIIVPDNDIDVEANAKGPNYRIGNIDYNAAQTGTLVGTVEHRNKLAPYATIGFRPNISDKWGIFGEIGAAYLGKTDATVRSTNPNGPVVATTVGGTTTVTGNDVAIAAEKELQDKNWLEWLPIVKLGATYRF
ncbi:hypothetical protein [Psychrobacter jeotgali]|uniref:hypothetical protein n=1 Tax=Psychrobacter jeotgali TaxID=179010 RepID=UPI0019196780|nr:hypothetical protein [Psychrobacter jeotgali]